MCSLTILKQQYKRADLLKQDYIKKMFSIHKSLFEYTEFIRSTDINKIEINENEVIFTQKQNNLKWVADRIDMRSNPIEILNFDAYEQKEINMIFRLISDGSVIFDIGANIGWYSLNIRNKIKNSFIYAFEPIRSNYDLIKKNIRLNNLNNIKVYNLGLSNKNDKIIFYYNPSKTGNTSIKNLSDSRNVIKIACNVKKMDDFVKKNNIKKIDFIKCDVEGAELLVFKGGKESLQKYKPIIFTEMLRKWAAKFDYHPNDIIAFLKNLGYLCFEIKNNRLCEFFVMDNKTLSTNFFFLHQQKHKKLI